MGAMRGLQVSRLSGLSASFVGWLVVAGRGVCGLCSQGQIEPVFSCPPHIGSEGTLQDLGASRQSQGGPSRACFPQRNP